MLTAEEAHTQGWDFPPMYPYRSISPRTCGNPSCSIEKTVWWQLAMEGKQLSELSEKQIEVIRRIQEEPDIYFKTMH